MIGESQLRLDASENQLLKLADGNASLKKMAEQLEMPISKVQQVAFRLIVVGLAEEVPDIDRGMSSSNDDAIAGVDNGQLPNTERTEISNAFLQSLVGFLQHKA